MKGKLRRILYVWGYYRLSTLFLLMIVLLAFAAFVCSSLNGVCFRMDPQPKSAKERMAILTGRLHLTFEQQIQIRPFIESSHENWNGGCAVLGPDFILPGTRVLDVWHAAYQLYAYALPVKWGYVQERPYKRDTIRAQRRMYLHLFYSPDRALEDEKAFNIKEPISALEIYRNKDMVEKAFENLKERLNMRRLTVSSEQSLDGKLFVQFIAPYKPVTFDQCRMKATNAQLRVNVPTKTKIPFIRGARPFPTTSPEASRCFTKTLTPETL